MHRAPRQPDIISGGYDHHSKGNGFISVLASGRSASGDIMIGIAVPVFVVATANHLV